MKKLWDKGQKLNALVETFETKGDLVLDQKLVEFDTYGTIAHAKGLVKIGILTKTESSTLIKGLLAILKKNSDGDFILTSGNEDVHTKIENYLTTKFGDIGKKVHTGRSRNDQVLTAIRLMTKNELLKIWEAVLTVAGTFLQFASEYEWIPMPGYTHMQKAMPMTVGMWAGSFVESLFDDIQLIKTIYKLNDQSPLGSAAGFGVPLPLDREYTAKLLGFATVQNNSLYCQNSRGKIEANILSSFVSIGQTINKFSSDALLFTTSEFDYFKVQSEFTTGSSIMPQKRNVDIAELLRSKVHLLLGNYTSLISLSTNLISGYNRDFQDSKKLLFESLEMIQDCLLVTNVLINGLKPNAKKLIEVMTPEIFATHEAFIQVKEGVPFREAYQLAAKNIKTIKKISKEDMHKIFKQSTHSGGTGNLGLMTLKKQLEKERAYYILENKKWEEVKKILFEA